MIYSPVGVFSSASTSTATQALMVVQVSSSLNAVDTYIKGRMESTFSHVVTVVEGDSLTSSDLVGKDYVWVTCSISSSTTADSIATVLVNAAIDCVICDGGVVGGMDMSDGSYPGPVSGFTDVVIETPGDALAASLSGTVSVLTVSGDGFSIYPGTGTNATNVAYRPGSSGQKMIYYYNQGTEMLNSNTAAGKRAGFFPGRDLVGSFTADGISLIDAMITYIST